MKLKRYECKKILGYVHIKTDKLYPFYEKLQSKRYITSCCGMSRQGFVFANDALTVKRMTETRVTLTANECFTLMAEMEKSAEIFQHTGGVHNAALCDRMALYYQEWISDAITLWTKFMGTV